MNRIAIVLGTMMLASMPGYSIGTLSIGEPTVEGNQVVIPVILGGEVGNGVASLDFRLKYNADLLQPVAAVAGTAAVRAEKRVMANSVSPGEYVVVMMEMNQTTCGSGEVAKIVMQRTADAVDGEWGLGIARPTLSSADGTVIASKAVPYRPKSAKPPSAPADPQKPNDTSTAAGQEAKAPPEVGAVASPGVRMPEPGSSEKSAGIESGNRNLAAALEEKRRVREGIEIPGTVDTHETTPENEHIPGTTTVGPANDRREASEAPPDAKPASTSSGAKTVEKFTSNASDAHHVEVRETATATAGTKKVWGVGAVTLGVIAVALGFVVLRRS
jgi:hypothetical protein